jgi:hypothetical protein
MSFKKNLKSGQAAIEYFVLFALLAALTIISAGKLLPQARMSGQQLSANAIDKIVKADQN